MQIRTWFGIFTLENNTILNAEIFHKDLSCIAKRLLEEPLLMRGSVSGHDLRSLAVEYGFAGSNNEYDAMIHELNIMLARQQIALAVTPDSKIVSAISAIDDLNETCNILSERLREWYIMNVEDTDFKGRDLALNIIGINGDLISDDLKVMQGFSSNLVSSYDTRDRIEEYLRGNMQIIAPNVTNIAGHMLGARLISIAGNLEKLASLPSSTIQVMGADNALFKHLKGKATSPKHGVIFGHPLVSSVPKWQHGKIARVLASKISLASRFDFYSGKLNQDLKLDLNIKVEAIRKQSRKVKK